jgi:hypothetical protein
VTWTTGITATEGNGVYIALDRELAEQFGGSRLLEVEFALDHPLVVQGEPCYLLVEHDFLEEPVNDHDSVWLRANKVAYQTALQDNQGHHGKAMEVVGWFLTDYLQKLGYDGVMIDGGPGDRWAVSFDLRRVKVMKDHSKYKSNSNEKKSSFRVNRLSRILLKRQALRMDTPKLLGYEDRQLLQFLDQYPGGLTVDQIEQTLGRNAIPVLNRLFQWGYLDRMTGQRYRTMGFFGSRIHAVS